MARVRTAPLHGRTTEAHVRHLMARAETASASAFDRIKSGEKLGPTERIELWRQLAGVVADCEAIRIWLDCGAPR